ncbi:MAG: Calcium-transporting ATPase [Phycisphaerae bacterium]|nr:Calcium-transporting ATPase [Phycisphaerae bacterium]
MSRHVRTLLLFLLTAAAEAAAAPRLIVVVSVDQLSADYRTRFARGLADDGFFRRVERDGLSYSNCRHMHAGTFTAPGHAVIMTGAYPHLTGIINNDWHDRRLNRQAYCVEDADAPLVGAEMADPSEGISPRQLLVPTVGDALKLATAGRAKVFGVSLKDRAGVLMAGHAADAAYWINVRSGTWVTSRYYRTDLPAYVAQLNDSAALGRWAGGEWPLLRDEQSYQDSYPDDAPFEQDMAGLGRAFPHRLPPLEPNRVYYRVLPYTPFGNDAVLEMARLLIEHEQLGADEVPDILAVGLSSNDYIGHAFGPFSREVQDVTFRTDVQLAALADFLDQHVADRSWLMFVTADHGVSPIPEHAASLRLHARRNPLGDLKQLRRDVDAFLRQRLGVADMAVRLVEAIDPPAIYLDRNRPELSGERFGLAQRLVQEFLADHPEVVTVFTREQILSGSGDTPILAQFRRAFHVGRSGDVFFALRPYTFHSGDAATHGTPWAYDASIPLMVLGPGLRAGSSDRRVTPASIAPTIARLLSIPEPPACEVEPLVEVPSAASH